LATLVACGGAPDAPPTPAPHIERRDALEASANELFEVVASGKVRIHVNQRFALKDTAYAHKALEARATSGSTILTN
jgi:NADPH2:quinone reductase